VTTSWEIQGFSGHIYTKSVKEINMLVSGIIASCLLIGFYLVVILIGACIAVVEKKLNSSRTHS
jgi:hypothetical protein